MYTAVDIGVLEDGRVGAFIIGDSRILGGFLIFESIVIRTNIRFLDGARTIDGCVPSEPHQCAIAPRQFRAVSPADQEICEGRVLFDPGLLMVAPMLAARSCRLRSRLNDDSRRGGFLFGIRRLLFTSGIVLHLEAGNGVVQTIILPAARVFPAGEPTLESLDGFEGPRSLDLLPLFRLTAKRRRSSFAFGRLEDPRQRLHLSSHLGQCLVCVSPRARRKPVIVAQGARKRPGRRRLRRAADGEGVAGEFFATAVCRVALSQLGDRLPRRLAAVQWHVERGPPLRRFLGILSGQHVFAFPKSPQSDARSAAGNNSQCRRFTSPD